MPSAAKIYLEQACVYLSQCSQSGTFYLALSLVDYVLICLLKGKKRTRGSENGFSLSSFPLLIFLLGVPRNDVM